MTSEGALPNLIVIGAQKCGTNALHYYLSLHPEISMGRFSSRNHRNDPSQRVADRDSRHGWTEPGARGGHELDYFIGKRNWSRGLNWYRAHFDPAARTRGETSPNYTAHPFFDHVPERMHSAVPNAKLIYLVRDPLERIAAHWVHNYARRREKGTLAQTLIHPNTSYIDRSRYAMQLERFLEYYPMERILMLRQSELRDERLPTLRRVFAFVGVDSDFTDPRFEQERHQTSRQTRETRLALRLKTRGQRSRGRHFPSHFSLLLYHRLPDMALRRAIKRPDVRGALPEEIVELLRADVCRLSELTGRDFSDWEI